MIVDRISLNIALKYLNQFEHSEGIVSNVLLSKKELNKHGSKSAKFDNISVLKVFIEKYAPLAAFEELDCSVINLYELMSFSVYKNGTANNYVYLSDGVFTTKSLNINQISVENLNRNYKINLSETISGFNNIRLNEYILNQEEYIDCGYIQTYFKEDIDKLKELYNKYK